MIAALANKLKINSGMNLLILNSPEKYLDSVGELGVEIDLKIEERKYSFIQVFVQNKEEVRDWADSVIQAVEYDGILWFTYPKKSSSLFQDLSRDDGWEPVKTHGLEGIASIAIDENWSAIRFRPKDEISKKKTSKNTVVQQPVKDLGSLEVPSELQDMLDKNSRAQEFFATLAPSYKRSYVEWIVSAKRQETKDKRLHGSIEKLLAGYKNPYAK